MKPVRSWPLIVLAAPAFVAVWSGWVGLGELTGFGEVHPLPGIADDFAINSAITLPIGVETYAAYALRAWLSSGVPVAARRFARWSAIGSLVLGAAGQVAYHLMSASDMRNAPWWITTVVACLPVAVLGMGAALAHLLHADTAEPVPATAVDPVPAPVPSTAVDAPTDSDAVTVSDTPPLAGGDTTAVPVSSKVTTGARGMRPGKRVPTADRVARMVARYPDATPAQIAVRLDLSERTVQRHLSRGDDTTTTTPPLEPQLQAA